MPRTILATILLIGVILSSCEKPTAHVPANESLTKEEHKDVPATFSAALDALDEMTTEDEKQAYRNDEVNMGLVHKQVGMRLRNDWGLWSGSELKDYFSERGIAHADWISSAIFEAWIERLKTGSFDEDAIIAKYEKIESEWREWSGSPDSYMQSEDDGSDPFGIQPAEKGSGG